MARYSSVQAALDALEVRNAELDRLLAERTAELDAVRRESALQAALERVRTQSMGAEHGDDTADFAVTVFDELRGLGVPVLQVGLSGGPEGGEDDRETAAWTAGFDASGAPRAGRATATLAGHPTLDAAFEAGQGGATLVERLDGPAFEAYLRAGAAAYPASYADRVVERAPRAEEYHVVYVPAGGPAHLTAVLSAAPTAGALDALRRFAALFGLAHARHRDLQRAEGLARTSQVEAALERVRARARAMRRSDAHGAVVEVVRRELDGLAEGVARSGVAVVDGFARTATFWARHPAEGDDRPLAHGVIPLSRHPLYEAVFDTWRRQKDLSYILEGDGLLSYYALVGRSAFGTPDAPYTPGGGREYVHAVPYPAGLLYAFAAHPFSEATVQVMQRLAGAFHFAHTRARDLERAEAQRRDAVQQASVDRVRAEIAQMRTVADLDQITPLVGRELTALGVPFFRCAVFIVDDARRDVQVYLATPEGRALASVSLAFGSHPLVDRVVDHWHRQEVLADQWDAGQMEAWAGLFGEHRQHTAAAVGLDAPSQTLALLFAPFAQGMLFVESAETLPNEDVAAVQALADAFAVAYARYDDYRQLEAKTAEVVRALADLRATQEQLVQSEKLASLGAVTAGIAHEIKNPLNFVNNFAILIAEIVDELDADLAAGASVEALRTTLDDLKANAETIAKHGQRADGIVRGMLQHARGGKGLPEPVDLNALVEEHVALAYHGKRAQTPGLSALVERDYDADAGRVVVVPQDIGRVLINLVNNALDAVQARAATADRDYTPAVHVRTARAGNSVVVRVEDNGTGIAPDALARVFEPFFTTKPPGAGTGLGLSISHDIVAQGHGGSLRVESVPGQGAAFVVTLPCKDPAPKAKQPAGRKKKWPAGE